MNVDKRQVSFIKTVCWTMAVRSVAINAGRRHPMQAQLHLSWPEGVDRCSQYWPRNALIAGQPLFKHKSLHLGLKNDCGSMAP